MCCGIPDSFTSWGLSVRGVVVVVVGGGAEEAEV